MNGALDALTSVLYVVCMTEIEALDFGPRADVEKLREHWRGRAEAAWSIRRHADALEPTVRQLWELIPARTPIEKSSREDLKRALAKVKALRTKIRKAKEKELRAK